MKFTWRVIEPCPATKDGRDCEREDDGHADHWYSVWEVDPDTGDAYPSYPVRWQGAA